MHAEYVGPVQNAAPTASLLTVAEVRAQARVDSDSEDTLIQGYIDAAGSLIQDYLGKSLFTQTFKLYLNYGFPYVEKPSGIFRSAPIILEKPPIQSVQKLYYVNTEGIETELTSDKYQTQLHGSYPKILPAYGLSWPDARNVLEAVRVEYTAGYGADTTNVPKGVIQAARMITASFYEGREIFTEEMKLQSLQEYSVLRLLLDPIKTRRIVAL